MPFPWMAIPAIASVASGFLGGDDDETETTSSESTTKKLDYPESQGARETWWDKISQWGGEKGYGAISPDWADIWGKASNRISQYFWGSPTSPGIADKVKSSAARRGVSDSPALENQMMKMGMEEAGQMGDLATSMATAETEYSETGRQNWLQQLGQIAGLTQGTTTTGTQTGPAAKDSGEGDAVGGLMKSLTQLLGDKGGGTSDIFKSISDLLGNKSQDSVLDTGGGSKLQPITQDWWDQ